MKKLILCALVAGFFIGCAGTKEPGVSESTPIEQKKIEPNFNQNSAGCTTGCMDAVIKAQEANKNIKR
ncbi:hypothetical protein OFN97_00815 [Campylobacter sp. VBCF_05 NA6]|uniref:hypothetical protein n=1 Tax=unclassified Campylobacter TaxID=2593542 RepID=UPI0022E9A5F8|nr:MULTISPECIES: hypothetical protein [unclassified Campylobacter]MDA3049283.1 hypothetical protein [Campylobacter sp. JMF_15 NE4]MDA3051292.1 hypothetical protein [Campylobacter sp. JMF_02 ED1]MDA3057660.1 hypothetical protein [Campylobacter sp. VBCF_04 NA7]MDA3058561.1 hypothetical protein [Campylobacter sp. VBCF_05 NA6]